MKKVFVALGIMALLPISAAAAPITFFGLDYNNSETVPLSAVPNSAAAEAAFLANLVGVGTETFESYAAGTTTPLGIAFSGAGTATIYGSGQVYSQPVGTAGAGRYSVPSGSTTKYWEAVYGADFYVQFSAPVAAFGFYGIDIGDFGGTTSIQLTLSGGGTVTLPISNAGTGAYGSVLYFGFYDPVNTYTRIDFVNVGGDDIFAFDNFTVGALEQVNPVPDPGSSLMLLGLGLIGLGVWRRR